MSEEQVVSTEAVSKKDQIIAEIKSEMGEIVTKHLKAAAYEINEVVIPKALDLVGELIPGQIDNAIIMGAKPIVKPAIDSMIGSA